MTLDDIIEKFGLSTKDLNEVIDFLNSRYDLKYDVSQIIDDMIEVYKIDIPKMQLSFLLLGIDIGLVSSK
jgi:transcriptional regulatory protein LevR